MAVPPFPSQDLAKLVLGYLAEEQLMTAYDEFLQASPYLDAMRNEYDRIFMTSLKSILAEYRAVKIYVEMCNPLVLRKKLFQCANLLEIVRFLIDHVDVSKLTTHNVVDQVSFNNTFKQTSCEVCTSLKLPNCVCKVRHNNQNFPYTQQQSSMANSVETTLLADLPGHMKNRKKPAKRSSLTKGLDNSEMTETFQKQSPIVMSYNHVENKLSLPIIETLERPLQMHSGVHVTGPRLTGSMQPINEFNHVFSTVGKNNGASDKNLNSVGNLNNKETIDSFQDFASGVKGVPAFNTSEKVNVQMCGNNQNSDNTSGTSRNQVYFNVGTVTKCLSNQGNEVNTANNCHNASFRAADPKVKILSDVKVDNVYKSNGNNKNIYFMNNLTNNDKNTASSTPLMKMQTLQTIVINGTPAYRPQPIQAYQHNFSRDEIMAMPTIIVVPSTDRQRVSAVSQNPTVPFQNTSATTTTTMQSDTMSKSLSPLIIDISQSPASKEPMEVNTAKKITNTNDIGLIKTVDTVTHSKNNSMPKDIVMTSTANNTPPVVPLVKKSSSTPRRTSHIRVLDFTTPRRILHETINEQTSNEKIAAPVEIILTDSPVKETSENDVENNNEGNNNLIQKQQIPIVKPVTTATQSNWDSKLRAMITPVDDTSTPIVKCNNNSSKKKRNNKSIISKDRETKKVSKSKKSKKKEDKESEQSKEKDVAKKVTINIIPRVDRTSTSTSDDKKQPENSSNSLNEQRIDTPESERITLQNVIGAKLNISELLETPYKQALYDIQMETPRCLGLDLPDEPMSDIKIMNIPTPRFLDTPKIVSTPSYTSRPTDYSSGSSYYKPDHDFIPDSVKILEPSLKIDSNPKPTKENSSQDKKNVRPVRKCAKNVSYYNMTKMKESDDKMEESVSSREPKLESVSENTDEKNKSKVLKDKFVAHNQDRKKKSSKKRKSPIPKNKPRTFMKIKPRRVTPVKISISSTRRNRNFENSLETQKKRSMSKEKNNQITTVETFIPTKSRRKSSTPRKLHCNKSFNSESSSHDSNEVTEKPNIAKEMNSTSTQYSDAEQLVLRYPVDGLQVVKNSEDQTNPANDSEDISQIQEYIETTMSGCAPKVGSGDLHNDLVKRGFDTETAKIIERDLLDTPTRIDTTILEKPTDIQMSQENFVHEKYLELEKKIENEVPTDMYEEEEDIELSLHECNEETSNFKVYEYDDTKEISASQLTTLKDKFTMEVCIDDDLTIRLRAMPFSLLYEWDNSEIEKDEDYRRTQEAVRSILNTDDFYTPRKAAVKAQVYDIFDSTSTSIDTPLKVTSPKRTEHDMIVTTIVLEEETNKDKEKDNNNKEIFKRKRHQSDGSDEIPIDTKKTKPDEQYLLSSANIQDIDIETVLKKLHGP